MSSQAVQLQKSRSNLRTCPSTLEANCLGQSSGRCCWPQNTRSHIYIYYIYIQYVLFVRLQASWTLAFGKQAPGWSLQPAGASPSAAITGLSRKTNLLRRHTRRSLSCVTSKTPCECKRMASDSVQLHSTWSILGPFRSDSGINNTFVVKTTPFGWNL